jgi:hypothetical protein
MEAPGVGIGNQEQFNYQARAFLDQIAGVADPLPPNATFADGLRSMEIIEAVVQSAQNGGAEVAVAPPASAAGSAAAGTATVPAPPARSGKGLPRHGSQARRLHRLPARPSPRRGP